VFPDPGWGSSSRAGLGAASGTQAPTRFRTMEAEANQVLAAHADAFQSLLFAL